MSNDLTGKVALVTGAAAGIGAAAAALLAEHGARVLLTDVDHKGADVATAIGDAGGEAMFRHQDVTQEEDWRAMIASVEERWGRLDILVNNAGVSASRSRIVDMRLDDWRRVQAINVDGPFLGIKHAAPLMTRGGGSIVNISSIMGKVGYANVADYCASKGGVTLLTKAAAIELAPDRIRVNSLHPGYIETPMLTRGLENARKLGESGAEERLQSLVARHPIGRLGLADEIASGVLFLASDASAFMTGAELVIDGGYTSQ